MLRLMDIFSRRTFKIKTIEVSWMYQRTEQQDPLHEGFLLEIFAGHSPIQRLARHQAPNRHLFYHWYQVISKYCLCPQTEIGDTFVEIDSAEGHSTSVTQCTRCWHWDHLPPENRYKRADCDCLPLTVEISAQIALARLGTTRLGCWPASRHHPSSDLPESFHGSTKGNKHTFRNWTVRSSRPVTTGSRIGRSERKMRARRS